MPEADRSAVVADDTQSQGQLAERPAVTERLDSRRHDDEDRSNPSYEQGHRQGAVGRPAHRGNQGDDTDQEADLDGAIDEEAEPTTRNLGEAQLDDHRLTSDEIPLGHQASFARVALEAGSARSGQVSSPAVTRWRMSGRRRVRRSSPGRRSEERRVGREGR